MIKKVSRAVFFSLALWCSAGAQSVLSIQNPTGLPVFHSTGPSLAIGGAGVGVSDDFFGMADNCANLGAINRAVFSGIGSLDFSMIDQDSRQATFWDFSPRLFSFAFPINPIGTFGVSLDRRSSLKRSNVSKLDTNIGGYDVLLSRTVTQNSGINAWQAGWGRAIGSIAKLGFSYERLYLSSLDVTRNGSSGLGPDAPGYDSLSYSYRGNGIRAGILVPAGKWSFGVSGEYLFKGDAQFDSMSSEGSVARRDISLQLPSSIDAGAAYTINSSWLAAASVGYTLWSDYRSDVQIGLNAPMRDALTVSAGARFVPAPGLLVPRYWEVMQYGLGFRYAQLPVSTQSETAVNLSLGLPLAKGNGLFDLIFEYGRRSDSRYTGYSENYFQIMIGINGGSKWFQTSGVRY
jgi:hypothetical protein